MNHLKNEKSPYLLQHADNPVDWYPWGEEALERARREDKPILLSIGYSTCHWCHVMAHESFEDEEVAAYMNAHFVNVKLGGWPLNVFLMPDLRPFFAGTYFPPEPRYGRMSWPQLLQMIAYNFYEKREVVEREAERITKALKEGGTGAASAVVSPKFPQVSSLRFMLAYGMERPRNCPKLLILWFLPWKKCCGAVYTISWVVVLLVMPPIRTGRFRILRKCCTTTACC